MNIEGTYKVNIEQTVRKLGESEEATIERMLGYVGVRAEDIPPDPKKEAKIQKMIADYQQDELATTMRLEIQTGRAIVRSIEGDTECRIKSQKFFGDRKVCLVVKIPVVDEDERWDLTVVGDRFLVFGGDEENEMSGFVWEKV